MRTWAEAVLAIAVVVALGVGLFLFTGESLGGSTETTEPIAFDPAEAARGQVTAERTGCLQCHTVDGATNTSGPTWKGLAGSNRPLASGESVTADDAYLRAAIIDPAGQVVQGYEAIMPPDYGEALTDEELEDLVAYINSLAS